MGTPNYHKNKSISDSRTKSIEHWVLRLLRLITEPLHKGVGNSIIRLIIMSGCNYACKLITVRLIIRLIFFKNHKKFPHKLKKSYFWDLRKVVKSSLVVKFLISVGKISSEFLPDLIRHIVFHLNKKSMKLCLKFPPPFPIHSNQSDCSH